MRGNRDDLRDHLIRDNMDGVQYHIVKTYLAGTKGMSHWPTLYGAQICKMYLDGVRRGYIPKYPTEEEFRKGRHRIMVPHR